MRQRLQSLLDDLRQRAALASAPGKPFLEVQIHPGDIRRSVRYLFLSKRRVLWITAGIVAWLALVGVGLTVAPSVVADRMAHGEYREANEERQELGSRLDRLVTELSELQTRTDDVRVRMAKIYLAYGFSERGQGGEGYPHQPPDVPESQYAPVIRQANGHLARITTQFGVLEAFLDEVQSFEAEHSDHVLYTPSLSPIESEAFVLTSPYGLRVSPFTQEQDFHPGVDFAATTGTPIRAPAAGVVAFSGRYPLKKSVGWWRYGNLVAIRHGERFITLYGHCDEVRVRAGQTVEQGDIIATVGNTGWSTNPHLHYEIRRRDDDGEDFQAVDPRIYILDHRWRDQERLLIQARQVPESQSIEPLPRALGR